ncbi:type VII secretion target [Goodfellowiella coeruleoviolacea]|uniref:Excreted virulence factor EspC, type VII ESX diderm n=1 Tax=Goodfellowiella coeruleoviolacea TaxID=334858 RepID=A0AAE3GM01_9PSEU|nr:type VII secretion target [Goodfellowiella coeruleoviolacea]MCP2170013.1 Excreted virulence factor EspC, type VII ESX diderm [Goodfellowiella coeruleoviolacea]
MGFDVVPDELRTFASGLKDRGGQVGEVATAADGVSLGVDTFGVIGQIFVGSAKQAAGEAAAGLKALSETLADDGDNTNATADTYADTDDGNASGLGGKA